ncbi:hypothetical protein BMR03_16150 [Methylococcaceae bacterium HT2]|nr:hypothetical protein BMR03_16150 [Methylococcaceae bacterium HT2]
MIFLDSCIVIDYINGRLEISDKDKNKNKNKYCINSIVDMEICVGARNKRELNSIKKKISDAARHGERTRGLVVPIRRRAVVLSES